MFGFGGGDGSIEAGGDSGGGGGVMAAPAGYIEIQGGRAKWRPIISPLQLAPLVLAAGFSAVAVLTAVRRLVR